MVEMTVIGPPQGVQASACPACTQPVWVATTAVGAPIRLDVEPCEEGTVELRRVGSAWFAETLAQTECLFEVDWPRWTPHRATCAGATVQGGGVPKPRHG